MNLSKWLQPGYEPKAPKKSGEKANKPPRTLPKQFRAFNVRTSQPYEGNVSMPKKEGPNSEVQGAQRSMKKEDEKGPKEGQRDITTKNETLPEEKQISKTRPIWSDKTHRDLPGKGPKPAREVGPDSHQKQWKAQAINPFLEFPDILPPLPPQPLGLGGGKKRPVSSAQWENEGSSRARESCPPPEHKKRKEQGETQTHTKVSITQPPVNKRMATSRYAVQDPKPQCARESKMGKGKSKAPKTTTEPSQRFGTVSECPKAQKTAGDQMIVTPVGSWRKKLMANEKQTDWRDSEKELSATPIQKEPGLITHKTNPPLEAFSLSSAVSSRGYG